MIGADPVYLLGILLSVGAALAIACSYLCIRIGSTEGTATDAVLIVMGVNLVILTPLVGVVYYPRYGITTTSVGMFVAAGLVGTLLARLCTYTSIDRIGASRTTPVVAARALVAAILGVVILGEILTPLHGIGVMLIVLGTGVIAWETAQENPDNLPRRELFASLGIAFGAAVAFGVEPIFVNWGLNEGTPAPVGAVIRTIAAVTGFVAYLRWRKSLPAFRGLRSPDLRWFGLAGVCNTLFLLGYYVALDLAPVSVVVPIIVINPLFVVILAAVFVPEHLERVTLRLIAAASIVVVGVLGVTLPS